MTFPMIERAFVVMTVKADYIGNCCYLDWKSFDQCFHSEKIQTGFQYSLINFESHSDHDYSMPLLVIRQVIGLIAAPLAIWLPDSKEPVRKSTL
jgi:hypothetical protein